MAIMYSSGIVSGDNYKKLKKVIVILITKYEIEENRNIEKTLTKWEIREEDYPKKFISSVFHIDF